MNDSDKSYQGSLRIPTELSSISFHHSQWIRRRIHIKILSRCLSASQQSPSILNPYNNRSMNLIRNVPGFSSESYQHSHQNLNLIRNRILPGFSSKSFQPNSQGNILEIRIFIPILPGFSLEFCQNFHQIPSSIVITNIARFLSETFNGTY